MERSSVKLAFLLLIIANASVLGPLTAEARCKEHKKPHKPKHAPSPSPTPLSQPPTPEPAPLSPPLTPEPAGIPPYQTHGCGYKCFDSNDCDWPCTNCCDNGTCCYDIYEDPMILPPSPSPSPVDVQAPSPPPILADEPSPVDVQAPAPAPVGGWVPPTFPSDVPPYQIHGCGYKCMDSNDCDWPCTECCYHSPNNYTCC